MAYFGWIIIVQIVIWILMVEDMILDVACSTDTHGTYDFVTFAKFNNVREGLNLLVRCFIVLNFMETNGNGKKRKANSKYGEVILRV